MGNEDVNEAVTTFEEAIDVNLMEMLNEFVGFIPKLIAGLIVLLLFWGLAYVARRVIRHIFKRRNLNVDVEELVEQAAYLGLLIVGFVTALGTMDVQIGPLIASLGLVGFAIGFALKDAVSNYLAGILLLVYHPFERRDHIAVAGHKGVVEDIDLRYTILDTEERKVLVPNSQLFSNVVTVEKPTRAGEGRGRLQDPQA